MTKTKTPELDGGIQTCARCGAGITSEMFSAPVSGTGNGVWDLKCFTYMTGLDRFGKPIAEQVSKQVLQDALRKAEQQQFADEMARKNAQADTIIQNIDALLLLVPNHERTSCTDENNFNWDKGRCTRCALIQAEADGFWRNDLDLEITVQYDEKHATGTSVAIG